MYSPHSIEPWVVHIAESCWLEFGESVLDLADEHLVRTDEGVVYARSVRRLAENSWSEENILTMVETPQRPKTTIADIPPS